VTFINITCTAEHPVVAPILFSNSARQPVNRSKANKASMEAAKAWLEWIKDSTWWSESVENSTSAVMDNVPVEQDDWMTTEVLVFGSVAVFCVFSLGITWYALSKMEQMRKSMDRIEQMSKIAFRPPVIPNEIKSKPIREQYASLLTLEDQQLKNLNMLEEMLKEERSKFNLSQ
jgi:hypothetical protein